MRPRTWCRRRCYAWRSRDQLEDEAGLRAWLYKIATNTCLDFLRRLERRPRAYAPVPGMDHGNGPAPDFLEWLQPFADTLLAPGRPDEETVARETIELVFLTAIQRLTSEARQPGQAVPGRARRGNALLGIHEASRGAQFEDEVRSILAHFLPYTYQVHDGFLRPVDGLKKELDIIISSRFLPELLQGVPVELITVAREVKTTLSGNGRDDYLATAAKLASAVALAGRRREGCRSRCGERAWTVAGGLQLR